MVLLLMNLNCCSGCRKRTCDKGKTGIGRLAWPEVSTVFYLLRALCVLPCLGLLHLPIWCT